MRTQAPLLFPEFDVRRHVSLDEVETSGAKRWLGGMDLGSAAPCVGIGAAEWANHSLFVAWSASAPDLGLVAFLQSMIPEGWPPVECFGVEPAAANRSLIDLTAATDVIVEAGYSAALIRSKPAARWRAIKRRLGLAPGNGGLLVSAFASDVVDMLAGARGGVLRDGSLACTTPALEHTLDALGYLVSLSDIWDSASLIYQQTGRWVLGPSSEPAQPANAGT